MEYVYNNVEWYTPSLDVPLGMILFFGAMITAVIIAAIFNKD